MAGVMVQERVEPVAPAIRPPRWGWLAGLAGVVTIIGAMRGPGLWADDWEWTRNRHFGGAFSVVDSTWMQARPVGGAVITAAWAPFGEHPVLLYALVAAANVGVAALLYRVCLRWLSGAAAMTVAVLWFALPVRTSLRMWPSTLNITAALALGLYALHRQERRSSPLVALAAGLAYAGIAPVGALAALVLRRDTPLRRRLEVAGAYGLSFVWSLIFPLYDRNAPTIDPTLIWSGHFGHGLAPGFGAASSIAVLAGSAWVLWRGTAEQRRLVVAGFVVVLAGSLPFLKFIDYASEGFADRARFVSSVGVALVLAAIIPRLLTGVAVAAMVLVFVGQTADYRGTYTDAVAWADRAPAEGTFTERDPHDRDGVWSVGWWENATAALQYLRDDPELLALPERHAVEP